MDSVDFILLQEVDISSKRSYHRNEVKRFSDDLSNNHAFYGKNYDVFFVPLPFTNPMGSVNSGVLSFSRYNPSEVTRISFPGQYSWPKRLFMLDRCFLVMRFPLPGGKQLLVVNTHNEAYDTGIIRDEQMAFLKKFLIAESELGNYMIVAGDWNQCPPDLQPGFSGDIFDTIDLRESNPAFFLPDGPGLLTIQFHQTEGLTLPMLKALPVQPLSTFSFFHPISGQQAAKLLTWDSPVPIIILYKSSLTYNNKTKDCENPEKNIAGFTDAGHCYRGCCPDFCAKSFTPRCPRL